MFAPRKVGVIGYTGAGKTTFIAVIYGLLNPEYSERVIPRDRSTLQILQRKNLRIDYGATTSETKGYLEEKLFSLLNREAMKLTAMGEVGLVQLGLRLGRKKYNVNIIDVAGEYYHRAAGAIASVFDEYRRDKYYLVDGLLNKQTQYPLSWSKIISTAREIYGRFNDAIMTEVPEGMFNELRSSDYYGYIFIIDRRRDVGVQDDIIYYFSLYLLIKHIATRRQIKAPPFIKDARFIVNVPVIIGFSKSEAEFLNWADQDDTQLNAAAFFEFKNMFRKSAEFLLKYFNNWRKIREFGGMNEFIQERVIAPVFYYSAFGRADGDAPILESGALRPWRVLLPLAASLGIKWW